MQQLMHDILIEL